MSEYVLPTLNYSYDALEPHISAKMLELHHKQHHATYVKKANEALEALDAARKSEDFTKLGALEKALAFNLSGHILHSIFWLNMAPGAGRERLPNGTLGVQIDRDFGSFDHFRRQMVEAASTIMGSGWAALVWEPLGKRLLTTQIYDHQSNLSQAGVPLLVIDAWEHAYYLQYQNKKTDFFEAVWNVFNWKDVSERFQLATKVNLLIQGSSR